MKPNLLQASIVGAAGAPQVQPAAIATPLFVLKEKEAEYYKVETPYTKSESFYYCVMPGNYPATMRTVMQKRGNWTEVSQLLFVAFPYFRFPKRRPSTWQTISGAR
jgi:hypothetical protein